MDPIAIIQKYYKEGTPLYDILLNHSRSVADKALAIADMHPEMNLDKAFIYEAAMLHDIGVGETNAHKIHCLGEHPYICHGYLGSRILLNENLPRHARVCESHIGTGLTKEEIEHLQFSIPAIDTLPETLEEKLVCLADKFFSKSKPNKEKSIDEIRKTVAKYGDAPLARLDDLLKLFFG